MSTELLQNCSTTHCGSTTYNSNVTSSAQTHTLENYTTARLEEADMPLKEVLKLSVELLIALFGVVGNVFVTIIISKMGKKTGVDLYLLNLAIADLSYLLLALPIGIIKQKLPFKWPLGKFFCLLLCPFTDATIGSSIWFIAIIAIQRYRKVLALQAKRSDEKNTSLRTDKIVVGFVWVTSYCFFSIPLNIVYRYLENDQMKYCGPVWPHWDKTRILLRTYIAALTLLSYILPLSVIALTYIGIARRISRSTKFLKDMKMKQNGDSQSSDKVLRWSRVEAERLQQNKRVRKVLTPLVLMFAITMLPLNAMRIVLASWPVVVDHRYYNDTIFVLVLFVAINSSANPVIYSLVNKNFRKALKELTPRRLPCSFNFLSRSWQPTQLSHNQMPAFYINKTFKTSESAIPSATSQISLLEHFSLKTVRSSTSAITTP
ncbi:hypothetical protein pdam_00003148 [Pocillopora damicornis]|uniref:G-protein coupled receptors family 1 profile domain-containing protein n=1 Tax=Pocillopora damicornis TaxID=46731 RepID=A0A3M6UAT1_POCDA|nr:galanin receptor type 1-like [Pocillopora damicornis]RMX50792.1 hypothetical protein pdam_00003148 [Pocillopora damicornis]